MLLRRLADEGRTILISSHVLSELEEVVDDAVFLLDGRTVGRDRVAAATTRVRVWRVRLAADASRGTTADRDAVAAALGRAPEDVGVDRRDLLVPFADEPAAVAGLRALVGAGIPVVEYAPAVGDLEHAFLDLRRGAAAEGSPE